MRCVRYVSPLPHLSSGHKLRVNDGQVSAAREEVPGRRGYPGGLNCPFFFLAPSVLTAGEQVTCTPIFPPSMNVLDVSRVGMDLLHRFLF